MTKKSSLFYVPEDEARVNEFLAGVYGKNVASNRRAYKKLLATGAAVAAVAYLTRRK